MFSPSLLGLLRKRTLFVESEFLKSNDYNFSSVLQLSRVIEKKIKKQTAMKLGSEPDLVKSEKTPDTKRRRYHSENDKERMYESRVGVW
jgi:hypothetical protein